MIGSAVERQGIIRHGAKMVTAVSEATVPKVSVIVRKAYGAGLYAMSGPAFAPDATIALPTARIAVMGPEAAVNAVFANKIAAIDDPSERERVRRRAALDLRGRRRPAAAGVRARDRRRHPAGDLRDELIRRIALARAQEPPLRRPPPRRPAGMSDRSTTVGAPIRDVGPRDGLQGERPVRPAERVELVRRLIAAGLRDIEVASFVSPKAVPAMAGAAEVVAAARDAATQPTATSRCGRSVPNVKGAELATAAGVDHLTITVSASAAYSEKNVHMTIAEAHGAGRPRSAPPPRTPCSTR